MRGRKTGGRKKGTPNKRTARRKQLLKAAFDLAQGRMPDAANLRGEAVIRDYMAYSLGRAIEAEEAERALLQAGTSQSEREDARSEVLKYRKMAFGAAVELLPYESPRLSAVQHSGEQTLVLQKIEVEIVSPQRHHIEASGS